MARHAKQHERKDGRSLDGRVLLTVGLAGLVLLLELGATYREPSPSVQESRKTNGRSRPPGERPPLPNVLVIVTDDQRDGTFNVMPKTRRWLVARGRKFVNTFATTPLCCPSRASIFTGRYTHNHGVKDNKDWSQLDHTLTMQRYLNDAGYFTAAVGKFLNDWPLRRNPPHFDKWLIQKSTRPPDYYGASFNVNGTVREIRGYSVDIVGRKAARFIRFFETDDSRPWLLHVAPIAPHAPAIPAFEHRHDKTPKWLANPAVAERNRRDKPAWVRKRGSDIESIRRFRKRQLRTLMSVDDLVGRIARNLSRYRERRRTLVILLSDNGYLWGEHGLGKKGYPYTQSIEVPMLLQWHGHVPRGTSAYHLTANVDVAPTVLDAAGITPEVAMDGRSLLRPFKRDRILLEYWRDKDFAIPPWASIRTARYQYVEYYLRGDRRGPIFREYYRLRRDPWQLHNVLGDGRPANNPNVRRLHRKLLRDSSCAGSECP